ncbi:MAG: fatty-acid oxidation protein subunit alpha [Bacteroidetes bacterium]|nr:MAG: fatty-acid oxidation protein subunit alpha [Bacteroidota bacterium]
MAKDIFHELVKNALQKNGWQITHDPLTLKLSKRNIFIDLGAEKILLAEKNSQKIAVEIKSFVGFSVLTDFYHALGQYQLYSLALANDYPDWILYLAIPKETYKILKSDDLLSELLDKLQIQYLIFDSENKDVLQWIN